jgi:hypothetical protein
VSKYDQPVDWALYRKRFEKTAARAVKKLAEMESGFARLQVEAALRGSEMSPSIVEANQNLIIMYRRLFEYDVMMLKVIDSEQTTVFRILYPENRWERAGVLLRIAFGTYEREEAETATEAAAA